jgi:hypothetical protein
MKSFIFIASIFFVLSSAIQVDKSVLEETIKTQVKNLWSD